MKRAGAYFEILNHLSTRIVELSKNPLPQLDQPPHIEGLRNAFWDPPEDAHQSRSGELPGPTPAQVDEPIVNSLAVPLLGPRQMLAVEVRAVTHETWFPYPDQASLATLAEEIAHERRLVFSQIRIDPSEEDFLSNASSVLTDATAKYVRPILFVDPACFAREKWRTGLIALLRRDWRGALLVPVDNSDSESTRLVESFRLDLQLSPNERERIVIRISRSITEFRTAVISVVDEILARIVKDGIVQRSQPENDGPNTRPRITNVLDAAKREP